MNPGPLVFLATFFALATSWLGFVVMPQLQIGRQQQVEIKDTGEMYPARRPGLAKQGEEVYRANGCYYCHSQQVRPLGFGTDVARGWGARPSPVQSVAQDYLYDQPVMLGSQRVGPDLTNIGLRQTNEVWLLSHLYNPQLTSKGSTMPPYPFLFMKSKLALGEKPSPNAVFVVNGPKENYEILPTDKAKALVAYLGSLHSEAIVFETPPFPSTNAPAASTNAPVIATATNSVPTNSPAK
ncbi:MAG: cytochrome-c oxidase [Pedosphaera sp.]|nr:cytochrome-c oxidase [Pedosphaera sp.]